MAQFHPLYVGAITGAGRTIVASRILAGRLSGRGRKRFFVMTDTSPKLGCPSIVGWPTSPQQTRWRRQLKQLLVRRLGAHYFSDRRSVSDYRSSSYFLAAILRATNAALIR